ncbi:hypothetical protein EVAR_62330_1 [Eumeta japonica]|uniref:Uncharacterized protein n=1 Tax=Eumeta variegata TaxID=151549 RepID=A0A4C1Z5R8_EUMVA|nr:hypothetical protein EVAR_62330_1 [Eumeta japonica]
MIGVATGAETAAAAPGWPSRGRTADYFEAAFRSGMKSARGVCSYPCRQFTVHKFAKSQYKPRSDSTIVASRVICSSAATTAAGAGRVATASRRLKSARVAVRGGLREGPLCGTPEEAADYEVRWRGMTAPL